MGVILIAPKWRERTSNGGTFEFFRLTVRARDISTPTLPRARVEELRRSTGRTIAHLSLFLSLFLPFSFSCSPSPTVYVESWTDSIKHFRPMLLVASYFLASSIVCWVAPSASMYTAVSLFAGRIGGTLSRAKHTVERR